MFDGGSEGIFGEIYSSNIGVVGQGIDDRLDGKSGGCCLSSRRHDEWLGWVVQVLAFRGEGRTMQDSNQYSRRHMWAFSARRSVWHVRRANSTGKHAYSTTVQYTGATDLDLTV
jgi:hypothetical protein